MPTDAVDFHQEAAEDFDAAFDWYLGRSPDAALKFDAEVSRALSEIVRAPQRCAKGSLRLAGFCSGSSHLF